jgi:hypothetical protein
MQEYINNALQVLGEAVHFQPDGMADGWYLLAMAHAANGAWQPALHAANTYWALCCGAADQKTAKMNAVAKLLPVLLNLCKQCHARGDGESLLQVAQLAVEVAGCGWDRQTEEQLRDTLGAAAQAANGQGKAALGQALRQLQQQLPRLGRA